MKLWGGFWLRGLVGSAALVTQLSCLNLAEVYQAPDEGVYGSRVRVRVGGVNEFTDSLTITWEARFLTDTGYFPIGETNFGEGDASTDSGSWTTNSPGAEDATHEFNESVKLRMGLYRFETTITGDGTSIAVVCDQDMPDGRSDVNPATLELTVDRNGCSSDVGLHRQSLVTDFSGYIAGEPLPASNAAWLVADNNWVVEPGGDIGGQVLRASPNATVVATLIGHANVELLTRTRIQSRDQTVPPNPLDTLFTLRFRPDLAAPAGDAPEDVGYGVLLQGGDTLSVVKLLSEGGNLTLGDPPIRERPFAYSAGSWHWVRAAASVFAIGAAAWPADGTTPPALAIGLDTQPFTQVGLVTMGAAHPFAEPELDFISVGLPASMGEPRALPTLALTCDTADPPYYMCP